MKLTPIGHVVVSGHCVPVNETKLMAHRWHFCGAEVKRTGERTRTRDATGRTANDWLTLPTAFPQILPYLPRLCSDSVVGGGGGAREDPVRGLVGISRDKARNTCKVKQLHDVQ